MTADAMVIPVDKPLIIGGQRYGVTVFGSGDRVIVLLPAFLMTRHMQHRWALSLAGQGYCVITVDLIGDGEPVGHGLTGVPALAHHVLAVMDSLGVPRAVLGGTSIGASAALQVAITAPQRVQGLLLEGPFLERGTARAKPLMIVGVRLLRWCAPLLRILARGARLLPTSRFALMTLVREISIREPERSEQFVTRMLAGPLLCDPAALSELPTPALIIALRADPAHPARDAATLHARLEHSTLVRGGTLARLRLRPESAAPVVSEFLRHTFAATAL